MSDADVEQLQADADSARAAFDTIDSMFNIASTDATSGDGRLAYEAAANLCSGHGLTHLPLDIAQTISRAIETGYLAALADLRAGELDQVWQDSGGSDRVTP